MVVLDRHLPDGIDGLEIISEIIVRRPSVKIPIISGDESISDQRLARFAGADHYIVKPISFQNFPPKIRG